MASYLWLDKNRKAINCVDWDGEKEHQIPADTISIVKFDGAYKEGWIYDGQKLVDPNPSPASSEPIRVVA